MLRDAPVGCAHEDLLAASAVQAPEAGARQPVTAIAASFAPTTLKFRCMCRMSRKPISGMQKLHLASSACCASEDLIGRGRYCDELARTSDYAKHGSSVFKSEICAARSQKHRCQVPAPKLPTGRALQNNADLHHLSHLALILSCSPLSTFNFTRCSYRPEQPHAGPRPTACCVS